MTNPMAASENMATECIDPDLGEQLWRLDDPHCHADLAVRLRHHVIHCADCRLHLQLAAGVANGLHDGSLVLPADGRNGRFALWSSTLGAAAIAAGITLLLALPPSPPHTDLVLRGDVGPTIERPVPDEVVRGGRPGIRWTPLEGATRYDVQVSSVDGSHTWSGSTQTGEITIPVEHTLPTDTRFRVRVAPVPAHLAPDGALRSSFRTGRTGDWLRYRLARGASAGRWLGGVGLMSLLVGAAAALGRRSIR